MIALIIQMSAQFAMLFLRIWLTIWVTIVTVGGALLGKASSDLFTAVRDRQADQRRQTERPRHEERLP